MTEAEPPALSIRALLAGETALHREIRLAALADAPGAFGDTWAAAAARPASYWDDLTRVATAPERNAMFIALAGAKPVGCTYGLLDTERADTARVGGMWVHPDWRRHGFGVRLLHAVIDWGATRGRPRVALWVAVEASGAAAMYARSGFQPTGQQMPIREGALEQAIELARE